MPDVMLDRFAGGFVSLAQAVGLEPQTLVNVAVESDTLATTKGATQLVSSGIPSGVTIETLRVFSDDDGQTHILAKAGTKVYIATPAGGLTPSSTLAWKPLVGDVIQYGGSGFTNPAAYYIKSRSQAGPESFVQFGSDVYKIGASFYAYSIVFMAADRVSGNTDYGYRYAGFTYSSGTAAWTSDDGNRGVVTGTTNFENALVQAGDIIYFYNHTSGSWRDTSGTPGYVIDEVTGTTLYIRSGGSGTAQYTTGTGPAGVNNVDFHICRISPIGVNLPGTSGEMVEEYAWTSFAKTCSGTIASAAQFYDAYEAASGYTDSDGVAYVYRYGDDRSVTYTNLSDAGKFQATTGTPSGFTVTLSGWVTEPDDPRLNTLQIFRAAWEPTTDTIGAYYLLTSIPRQVAQVRTSQAAFATGYTDTSNQLSHDADNVLTGYDSLHNKPYYGTMRGLALHSGRLVSTNNAYGDFSRRQLQFSWLYAPTDNYNQFTRLEYWNTRNTSPETGDTLEAAGGWYPIGGNSEVLTALAFEGNSYADTGFVVGALLAFTNRTIYRIHGGTWLSLTINQVAAIDGPLEFKHVVNADGTIYWLGRNGVYALRAGSSVPVLISSHVWPGGLTRHITGDVNTILRNWKLQYLGDKIAVIGSLTSSTVTDFTYLFSTRPISDNGRLAFTELKVDATHPGCTALDYLNLPTDTANQAVGIAASSGQTLYALYDPNATAACVYQSLPAMLSESIEDTDNGKDLKEVEIYVHPDNVDRTLTLQVYDHKQAAVVATCTGTVTGTTAAGVNRILRLYPEITCVRPSFKLSWTATQQLAIIYVKVTWLPQGDTALLDTGL